ncbi:hypothetical protein [Anaerosporobacter faecicola]|uniref:hypothetical protein n=1 Tax=Anaerosporobacter faecicola TaxID=2718714 RepID=UPI00143965A0|nr:hypothetical protein [Anaerosporobacter faecicola]
MEEKILSVIEYLRENYQASKDICGEEDNINTIPSKEAYKNMLAIYSELKSIGIIK